MSDQHQNDRKLLAHLDLSLTHDLLSEAYSADEIRDALRALGANPEEVGMRGASFVAELLERLSAVRPPAELPKLLGRSSVARPLVRSHGENNRPGSLGNREFEFKQLFRAYRSGLITRGTFESEMNDLEAACRSLTARFEIFGKICASESEAVIWFLDSTALAEAVGGDAIRAWLEVCRLDCVKGGLKMIAERESYHGRAFAQRLAELGGAATATVTDEMRKSIAYLSDPGVSDLAKLQYGASRFSDPEAFISPIVEFADRLRNDEQTKEMIMLFAQDELSTLRWQNGLCAMLARTQTTRAPSATT